MFHNLFTIRRSSHFRATIEIEDVSNVPLPNGHLRVKWKVLHPASTASALARGSRGMVSPTSGTNSDSASLLDDGQSVYSMKSTGAGGQSAGSAFLHPLAALGRVRKTSTGAGERAREEEEHRSARERDHHAQVDTTDFGGRRSRSPRSSSQRDRDEDSDEEDHGRDRDEVEDMKTPMPNRTSPHPPLSHHNSSANRRTSESSQRRPSTSNLRRTSGSSPNPHSGLSHSPSGHSSLHSHHHSHHQAPHLAPPAPPRGARKGLELSHAGEAEASGTTEWVEIGRDGHSCSFARKFVCPVTITYAKQAQASSREDKERERERASQNATSAGLYPQPCIVKLTVRMVTPNFASHGVYYHGHELGHHLHAPSLLSPNHHGHGAGHGRNEERAHGGSSSSGTSIRRNGTTTSANSHSHSTHSHDNRHAPEHFHDRHARSNGAPAASTIRDADRWIDNKFGTLELDLTEFLHTAVRTEKNASGKRFPRVPGMRIMRKARRKAAGGLTGGHEEDDDGEDDAGEESGEEEKLGVCKKFLLKDNKTNAVLRIRVHLEYLSGDPGIGEDVMMNSLANHSQASVTSRDGRGPTSSSGSSIRSRTDSTSSNQPSSRYVPGQNRASPYSATSAAAIAANYHNSGLGSNIDQSTVVDRIFNEIKANRNAKRARKDHKDKEKTPTPNVPGMSTTSAGVPKRNMSNSSLHSLPSSMSPAASSARAQAPTRPPPTAGAAHAAAAGKVRAAGGITPAATAPPSAIKLQMAPFPSQDGDDGDTDVSPESEQKAKYGLGLAIDDDNPATPASARSPLPPASPASSSQTRLRTPRSSLGTTSSFPGGILSPVNSASPNGEKPIQEPPNMTRLLSDRSRLVSEPGTMRSASSSPSPSPLTSRSVSASGSSEDASGSGTAKHHHSTFDSFATATETASLSTNTSEGTNATSASGGAGQTGSSHRVRWHEAVAAKDRGATPVVEEKRSLFGRKAKGSAPP